MKRTISFIILALVTLCSVFAGSRELKLTYTEKAYFNFDFLYGSSLLTENGNNEQPVTLTKGESEPITVRWNYNIGPTAIGSEQIGLYVSFVTEGFKHTAEGVNDKVDVFFEIKAVDDNSNLYTQMVISQGREHVNFGSLSFIPKTNMRGSADVAEVTVNWDQHNWIAGEYSCDIKIYFSAE